MPRKHKRPVRKQPPTLLILIGIALLVIAVFALKSGSNAPASAASLKAELNQALKDGRPTFVFLHSLDCIPCKEMMGVVADVFTLQTLLGHSSLDMVRHYAKRAQLDVEQAHRRASPADNWRL